MRLSIIFSLILIVLILPASSYQNNANFTYLDGSTGSLSSYEGKTLLVDAMASWCTPCKIGMAHLYDAKVSLGDQISILSVSVSPTTDDSDKIKDFKASAEKDNGQLYTWDFAIDQDLEVMELFQIAYVPSLILLDYEGNVVKKWEKEPVEAQDIVDEINANITVQSSYDGLLLNNLLSNPAFIGTASLFIIMLVFLKIKPKTVNVG